MAGRNGGVDVGGRGQRVLPGDVQERAILAVGFGDPVQACLRDLHRRQLLGGDLGAQRRSVQPGHVVVCAHSASPRIRGTAKRPSADLGACDSACSWDNPGSTTSGRVTLTDVNGLSVASTSVTSTAWI